MKQLLSVLVSIGEMDTAYVVIAFIAIAILWIIVRMINKNQK